MLRAIERAHAAIVFGPDADVLQLRVGSSAGRHYFRAMAPIHALEMNRTVHRIARQMAAYRLQECRKLGLRHLAGCHGELAVLNCAEASDMPGNRYVVRRIGEYHLRPGVAKELLIGLGLGRIAADQAMVAAEVPDVAQAANRRASSNLDNRVSSIVIVSRKR